MVFSSTPRFYLDPPNWQPQLGSGNDNSQLLPPPPVEGGGRQGLTRPVSMTDRARLAKLPQSEMALKCPRCESTNTKFCYFNNYSLSQPRHFCKTCRRYWTRGGALRNVPVGGGCRRNKRTKGSRSESPVTADHQTAGNCSSNSTNTTPVPCSSCITEFIPQFAPYQPSQLPFMPSLHHVTDYGAGDQIGFSFGSDSAGAGLELPMSGSTSSGQFCEQWRLLQQFHQLPFSEPPPPGNYLFDNNEGNEPPSYVGGAAGQLGPVKSEEDQGGVNLSRNFLGMNGNDEYWGGNININAWTTNDLNVFTPSTTC